MKKTLNLDEETAKKLYSDKNIPDFFRQTLEESFGKDFFISFHHTNIKSFEDACEYLGINPKVFPDLSMLPDNKPMIAHYKLMIIYKAINKGYNWVVDFTNSNQRKYYPYFECLNKSSNSNKAEFVFSHTTYDYGSAYAGIGSRLCAKSSDVAEYIGRQFEKEYNGFLCF